MPRVIFGIMSATQQGATVTQLARALQPHLVVVHHDFRKRADFAVLHDDPLAIDPMALKDVRVWGTVLSGRVHPAGS